MLTKTEKKIVVGTMKMFADQYIDEDLIKMTARYVSSQLTTWKRKSIYEYSRSFHKNRYGHADFTPYHIDIEGDKQYWYCVLWYDKPLIFQNGSESALLVQIEDLSKIEIFNMVSCSYEYIQKIAESHKDSAMDVIKKMGIKTKKVYRFYNDITCSKSESTTHKMYDWSDELYDTNPEWFI